MTTTTRLGEFISTIIDIGILGLEVAITILSITLSLLAIPKVANLKDIELIGMVAGFLLSGWIFYALIDVFRFTRKVEISKAFWATAFVVGGSMIAQYIADPFASISVSTIIQLALFTACPAWAIEAMDRGFTKLQEKLDAYRLQRAEKRKNEHISQRLITGNEPDGITPEELTLRARIEALELQQQRLV